MYQITIKKGYFDSKSHNANNKIVLNRNKNIFGKNVFQNKRCDTGARKSKTMKVTCVFPGSQLKKN